MNFYENTKNSLRTSPRKWLVTGSAGFIGSNLVEALLKLDQKVVAVDNFITGHRKNWDIVRAEVGPEKWENVTLVDGTVCDKDTCEEICAGVDSVLHQAALGSVPRSIKDPIASNDNNVTGFLNLLTAAKDQGVKNFVYASSSSVYGDHPDLPKFEDKIGTPLSPYAVTKKINELYADVFKMQYDIKPIGLRYFNVFGRRQDPEGAYAAVMPKWFASLVRDEEVYINGDGETSRDFCYIDNTVQANILAGSTDNEVAKGRVYNVACGEKTTLNELFSAIRNEVAKIIPSVSDAKPAYRDFRAGDIRHSLANIDLIREHLGYDPTHGVTDGLTEAAAWYVKNLS